MVRCLRLSCTALVLALFSGAGPAAPEVAERLEVPSKVALVHLGSLDSFDRTEAGTKAAGMILEYVEKKRLVAAHEALAIYEKIIPRENFGGEYTALQWLAESFVASPQERKKMLADPHVAAFHDLLAADDYAVVKEYLRRKYRLEKIPLRETQEAINRHRFQEDFFLFNNPRRERWEKSSKIVEVLGLKKGGLVADVGSGPGYFTFKFADIVGPAGKVFAIDTNEMHLDYLARLVKKLGIRNVEPINPPLAEVGVPAGVQLDCVFMCSLYHIIYSTFTEEEREKFLASIKRALKPDGTFVVVDNALVEDSTLPYHGPYLARELLIAQLQRSGFTLKAAHQFIPQRYVLVFEKSGRPTEKRARHLGVEGNFLRIRSAESLVQYIKPGPGPEFSLAGRKAAKEFYRALEGDRKAARSALEQYRALIPREQFGNEYTAFAWFCEYLLAAPEERKRFLADPFVADYFRHLGGDRFTELKKYVRNKYFTDSPDDEVENPRGIINPRLKKPAELTQDELTLLHEFVVFNNPRRETWEKTSKILEFLKLKPGDCVADVGCGPGYYTFKFADRVGKKGRVYALETNEKMLDSVRAAAEAHGLANITSVRSYYNDTKLPPESVDLVYFCSLYHAVYVTTMEHVRDQFIASIKKALRKGGKVVIVDNELSQEGCVPYYGPRIDRRLIILQLKHYGFRLVSSTQFIPQRYVLVFQRDE